MPTGKEKMLELVDELERGLLATDISAMKDAEKAAKKLRAAIESGAEDNDKTILIIDISKIGGGE